MEENEMKNTERIETIRTGRADLQSARTEVKKLIARLKTRIKIEN
jgi:hypothetical protein